MIDLPIACTLTPEQHHCEADKLLPSLAQGATRVARLADGVEMTFTPSTALLPHIASVLDTERQCCRFLHFTLEVPPGGGDIRLSVVGPPGTGAFLESLSPTFAARAP